MSPTATQPPPPASRGAVAHGDEELLDLVAAVAREAERQRAATAAALVSMPVFNRVKLHVDRDRGIADPARDPHRTPTAEAVHLRFNKQTDRSVPWSELVRVALLADRTRWLSALRREERAEWLTQRHVTVALRRVAFELDTDELDRGDYRDTRAELLAEDEEVNGADGVLARLLPTLGQIEGTFGWKESLAEAGLGDRAERERLAGQARAEKNIVPAAAGVPPGHAMAFYAACNGAWPSRPKLRAFATAAGFALADFKGQDWDALIADGHRMLLDAGVEAPAPARPRGGGRGKRAVIRYPANGIPGTPPLLRGRDGGDPKADSERARLMREFSVIAVRVWLATPSNEARRGGEQYKAWRRETGADWPAINTITRHGGLGELKPEARAANERDRRAHGEPVPETVLARAEELRLAINGRQPAPGTGPGSVPFADQVQAVIAGPHAEVTPPKQ